MLALEHIYIYIVAVRSWSHVWFFVTPLAVNCQAPLSMGFSRQEYWSGLPFPYPWSLPNPGIEPVSSALAGSLPLIHQGSPVSLCCTLETSTALYISYTSIRNKYLPALPATNKWNSNHTHRVISIAPLIHSFSQVKKFRSAQNLHVGIHSSVTHNHQRLLFQ